MNEAIGLDVQGYEILTHAVLEMLEAIDERFRFEEMTETSGLCFDNDSGSLILSEKNYITGGYERKCSYPFFIIYRSVCKDEKARLNANLKVLKIGDALCSLTSFPELSGGRKITRITYQNSYGSEINEANSVQDWILPVTVEYTQRREF